MLKSFLSLLLRITILKFFLRLKISNASLEYSGAIIHSKNDFINSFAVSPSTFFFSQGNNVFSVL